MYVSWIDSRVANDHHLWVTRSTDAGVTWPALETQVDHGSMKLMPHVHAMSCDESRIHLVWLDNRGGGDDNIYVNGSADGGATFRSTDVRVNATAVGRYGMYITRPQICCEGTDVHVGWWQRALTTDPWQALHDVSRNGGVTFRATDVRLDTGPGAVVSGIGSAGPGGPYLCCDGGVVHAVWSEERTSGQEDVFLSASPVRGATWLPADVRLDTDAPGPGNSRLNPWGSIACDGAIPYVVWWDDRRAATSFEGDVVFGTMP